MHDSRLGTHSLTWRLLPLNSLSGQSSVWLGSFIALISATAFALNVTFVSVAFDHGANVHVVNLLRMWFFFGIAGLVVFANRTWHMLPPRQRYASFAVGALLCVEVYSVNSALLFIPVGLTILIMYTYPLIVTLIASFQGRHRLSLALMAAMLVAFLGLAFALKAPVGVLDWRGVGLAVIAALGMTALVIISERTMEGFNHSLVMLHATLAGAVLISIFVLAGARPVWPGSAVGMLALFASTVLYAVATFLLFTAIGMIGPVRFAVIDNTSPAWAVLFSFVLLGETLVGVQYLGFVMVIGGVIAVQVLNHRSFSLGSD